MTAVRQREKGIVAILGAAALMLLSIVPVSSKILVDPHTGLAISGFDPVAYFTDAKAEVGRPELELSAEGAVWRFRNEGNRTAFAAHPEVYRPAFGGYDPVAIARDRSVAGHPLFWAITGRRLYLFYSAENRAAFLADRDGVLARAYRQWPSVEKSIVR